MGGLFCLFVCWLVGGGGVSVCFCLLLFLLLHI